MPFWEIEEWPRRVFTYDPKYTRSLLATWVHLLRSCRRALCDLTYCCHWAFGKLLGLIPAGAYAGMDDGFTASFV